MKIYLQFSVCYHFIIGYILENVYNCYKNQDIVDRLSLAYIKFGEKDKAIALLDNAFEEEVINKEFHCEQLEKIKIIEANLPILYERNARCEQNIEFSNAILSGGQIIVGMPTSRDIFDTERAVGIFKEWFEEDKNKYPEFINLFLYLMARDGRQYS